VLLKSKKTLRCGVEYCNAGVKKADITVMCECGGWGICHVHAADEAGARADLEITPRLAFLRDSLTPAKARRSVMYFGASAKRFLRPSHPKRIPRWARRR